MGIHCEISLFKPNEGVYLPGSLVSGVIRYAVDEEILFKAVTISLKGIGRLFVKRKHRKRNSHRRVRRNTENYAELHNVIKFDNTSTPVGSYDVQFNFILPQNIPATFEYHNSTARYIIDCKIFYYIRIKFEKLGFMKTDKHFKKRILVASYITPKLPVEPTACYEKKTLTQFFSKKKSVIYIKAKVQKCVFAPGEKIQLDYEVINDTNLTINGVEIKLVEVYEFESKKAFQVESIEDLPESDSKTGALKSDDILKMTAEMILPWNSSCVENSKIVKKYYAIIIRAETPLPHRDAVLKIPIQVGHVNSRTVPTAPEPDLLSLPGPGSPPSYWEAMGEGMPDDDIEKDN